MIAVLLHYFHLSTAVWGLCHSFAIYDYVVNENVPVIKYNNIVAFGASAVFVLVSVCGFGQPLQSIYCFSSTQFSFAISSNSYEIFDYCWMSVQKSMIFNFMIPTSILIISNTIFGTMTLRSVVTKQRQVIVESIENSLNILDKCQTMDAAVNGVNLLASDANINTDYIPNVKCCDEMDKVDNILSRPCIHIPIWLSGHWLTNDTRLLADNMRQRLEVDGFLWFEIRFGSAVDCWSIAAELKRHTRLCRFQACHQVLAVFSASLLRVLVPRCGGAWESPVVHNAGDVCNLLQHFSKFHWRLMPSTKMQ